MIAAGKHQAELQLFGGRLQCRLDGAEPATDTAGGLVEDNPPPEAEGARWGRRRVGPSRS